MKYHPQRGWYFIFSHIQFSAGASKTRLKFACHHATISINIIDKIFLYHPPFFFIKIFFICISEKTPYGNCSLVL